MEQPKDTTDAKLSGSVLTPEVTWAQRSSTTEPEKNHIFLTIAVPDVDPKKIQLDVQPTSITFKGYSISKKADYAVTLELYAEIDPSASKTHHTSRAVEFVLQKKDLKEEYWPRLLKDPKRVHYLKTNFDRWVDEDEQDEANDEDDYMSRMNPMGGGGADGGFGGIDFSKLGGGGGMGGMEGFGGGEDDEEDEEEEDDDDEMPGLEGEASSSSKIQEVK